MKKYILIIFILNYAGCSDDSNSASSYGFSFYGNIAYNSLSKEEKASLLNGNVPGKVEEGNYAKLNEKDILILNNQEIMHFTISANQVALELNQKLIAVTFNTKDDSLLGPIIIMIDSFSENVIGFVGRL